MPKWCNGCEWSLPTRMFYPNSSTDDGLSVLCKQCTCRQKHTHNRPPGYMSRREVQEANVGCKIGKELIYKPKSKTRLLAESRKKRGPYLRCMRKRQRKAQVAREVAAVGLLYGERLQNDLIAAAGNTQVCFQCKQELPLWADYFHRQTCKTGFKRTCKDCVNADLRANRPRKLTNAEYWAEVQRKEDETIFKEKMRIAARDAKNAGVGIIIAGVKMQTLIKVCADCAVQYPMTTDYFHRCKRMKDGLASKCKKCLRKRKKT